MTVRRRTGGRLRRTWQETVGGPNGAKRSEFRRRYPPVRVKQNVNEKLPGPDGPGSFQI